MRASIYDRGNYQIMNLEFDGAEGAVVVVPIRLHSESNVRAVSEILERNSISYQVEDNSESGLTTEAAQVLHIGELVPSGQQGEPVQAGGSYGAESDTDQGGDLSDDGEE